MLPSCGIYLKSQDAVGRGTTRFTHFALTVNTLRTVFIALYMQKATQIVR